MGFSWYTEGERKRGNWKCRSRGCGSTFPETLLGLIRGVLSHRHKGWGREGDETCSHNDAVDWLATFLEISLDAIPFDPNEEEMRDMSRVVTSLLIPQTGVATPFCERDRLLRYLQIPSPYFLARGYAPATLIRHDVGTIPPSHLTLGGRIMIPIYTREGADPVGAIARSPWDKCPQCKLWHDPTTPCPQDRLAHVKYRTVGRDGETFDDKDYLYNLHLAFEPIRARKRALVVEGAADAWRLHEAGYDEGVAILGNCMNAVQALHLIAAMPRTIYILTDNNEAGEAATASVERRCPWANVRRVRPPVAHVDFGEMKADALREYLGEKIR